MAGGTENTHLQSKGEYNCSADLLFDWFGFDKSKAAESNQIEQVVTCTVILPFTKDLFDK